jgi:hypothetical protein
MLAIDSLKTYVHDLVNASTADGVLLSVARLLSGGDADPLFQPPPPVIEKPKVRRTRGTSRDYLPVVKWARKFAEIFTTEQCMKDLRAKGSRLPSNDAKALKMVAAALSKSSASIWNYGDGTWRYKHKQDI